MIRRGGIHEQAIDLAADQIGHRIGDGAVGHALQFDPGELAEIFRRRARRGIEMAEGEFAGRRLGGGDEAGEVAPRRLRPHHQVAAAGAKHADHGEVPRGIVGQVAHEAGIGGMGAGGDQQHRVAVGLGDLHRHGADDAVGAGAVVDHDRLFGFLLDLLADQARGDVARPARSERHDDLDRPGRILGGADDGGHQRRSNKRENRTAVDHSDAA